MNDLYDNVKNKEIFSPISRDPFKINFNEADINLCNVKLSRVPDGQAAKVDQS